MLFPDAFARSPQLLCNIDWLKIEPTIALVGGGKHSRSFRSSYLRQLYLSSRVSACHVSHEPALDLPKPIQGPARLRNTHFPSSSILLAIPWTVTWQIAMRI